MSTSYETSTEYFESMYQRSDDPWNFAGSEYEQARYAAMDSRLGLRRFVNAFEPACSVGVFTQRLSLRCERVVASDAAPTAVVHARRRCETLSNVHVLCAELPQSLPEDQYDLIVIAECGYYFSAAELGCLVDSLTECLWPDGVFLACHSLQQWPDHQLHGDQVHEIINQDSRLLCEPTTQPGHALFRLDLWRKL